MQHGNLCGCDKKSTFWNLGRYIPSSVNAKSFQSCTTLYDPMDCSPPDSSIRGILQAKILACFHALLQGIFLTQGLNLHLMSPVLAVGSIPLVPSGKPQT